MSAHEKETDTFNDVEDAEPSEEDFKKLVISDGVLPVYEGMKHPLQNRWALWFFKNEKGVSWEHSQYLIANVDTIEGFWALYNYVQPASKIPNGCDYSLFKDGIRPMWEDAKNKKGGRWLINLSKSQRATELDKFWLETLLCLIGESFGPHSDSVCGAVINLRPKGDKLGLWTAEASQMERNKAIGVMLKEHLNIPLNTTIGYEAHQDTMSKSGSMAKLCYQV